jgi:epoxyqueuosine reductase
VDLEESEATGFAGEIKEILRKQGADLVGIASAESLNKKAPPGYRPEDFLPGAQSAVMIGLHMLDTVFNELPERTDIYTDYFMYAQGRVRGLEWHLTRFLESKGFRAMPCLGPSPSDLQKAPISLKHFAVEAGLGVFALSNLLVTPEFGPRVRLGGVITEASLAHDQPLNINPCAEAQSQCESGCVKGCPAEALSISGQMKRAECYKYYFKLPCYPLYQESGRNWRCGLCITNCPVGSQVFRGGYKHDPEGRKKRSLELTTLSEEELSKRIQIYFHRRKLAPELIVDKYTPPL